MGLKITGTGSSIPKITQKNDFFSNHNFYDIDGKKIEIENQTIIEKFKSITGINERKYALPSQNTALLEIRTESQKDRRLAVGGEHTLKACQVSPWSRTRAGKHPVNAIRLNTICP